MADSPRSRRVSRNNITGPTSALTNFLASHNISANEIRRTANARRQAAEAQAQGQNQSAPNGNDGDDDEEDEEDYMDVDEEEAVENEGEAQQEEEARVASTTGRRTQHTKAQLAKLKAKEKKAIDRIKASKKRGRPDDDDSSGDDNNSDGNQPENSNHNAAPRPGQTTNCASCDKRFTVSAYSRDAPGGDGGLLCSTCGAAVSKGAGLDDLVAKRKKKSRQSGGVGMRRSIQSRLLDGTFALGAKPLVTLCVETLVRNVDLADDLGDLPDHQVDRVARLVSKRRLLNPRTLQLFVRPSTERLCIYDAAYLGSADFISTFAVIKNLRHLKIRNGIQFKDDVMDYLITRTGAASLESIYIHGSNLLSDAAWRRFFESQGGPLRSLRIYYTDKHIGDDMVEAIAQHCPQLTRLKLYHNQKLTNKGIEKIAEMTSLRHLGLLTNTLAAPEVLRLVITAIGPNLETLSLRNTPRADDGVLSTIHSSCRRLSKLQITDSEHMTDQAFADLFTNWENPPLRTVIFERCRSLNSTRDLNADFESSPYGTAVGIGLCSNGFRALMAHSGSHIEVLNIHACRQISADAFDEVFGSPDAKYPHLRDIEISFCENVTPDTVRAIFKSCPALRRLNVFGCMKVRDRGLKVPPTVNMIGGADAWGLRFES